MAMHVVDMASAQADMQRLWDQFEERCRIEHGVWHVAVAAGARQHGLRNWVRLHGFQCTLLAPTETVALHLAPWLLSQGIVTVLHAGPPPPRQTAPFIVYLPKFHAGLLTK